MSLKAAPLDLITKLYAANFIERLGKGAIVRSLQLK